MARREETWADSEERDLPPLRVPPGYLRDAQGRWRYVRGGRMVPGARDLTLASLYGGVPRGAANKTLEAELVRFAPELAWCRDVGAVKVRGLAHGRSASVLVVLVPRREWERREHVVLGLVAPELMPERLLDAEGVARLVGVDRRTVAAYGSRGLLPEPVGRLANSPAWSLPIVLGWLFDRPGQGVGGGARASARRKRRAVGGVPSPRRTRTGDELLRWADGVLAKYAPEDE